MARRSLVILLLLLCSCKPTGPASTRTKSSAYPTIAERVAFLNQYVTFRRTYETLDFDIMFQNNGGGMTPAPSDYDVRLIATVAPAELQGWIPQGISPSKQDTDWLKSIPTQLDLTGVTEWYGDGYRIVGVDRSRRIVVYRAFSH